MCIIYKIFNVKINDSKGNSIYKIKSSLLLNNEYYFSTTKYLSNFLTTKSNLLKLR